MIVLLDVNVLLALAWPNHVHHVLARTWFEKAHSRGWATCPVTESGFVRISSNASIVDEARTPAEATLLLQQLIKVGGHRFWSDDVSIAGLEPEGLRRIRGHRQVTDAHLLALASRRGGKLATFDRRVVGLLAAAADAGRHVLVLE